MTRLKDLRVTEAYSDWTTTAPVAKEKQREVLKDRPATVSDLVAVLQAEGGEVVDTGWHPLKTYGDGPGVYIAPGRYLVFRLEVDGV